MGVRASSNGRYLSVHNVVRLLCSLEPLRPCKLYQLLLLFLPLTRNKDVDMVVYHREGTLGPLQFYSEDDMKSTCMPEAGTLPLELLLNSVGQLPGGL